MKKVRIVKRTAPDGRVQYIIQQKHFMFFWWWVDAWINSGSVWTKDDFNTVEEAQANLCYFDGTESTDKIIH